jgi:hypothetical protein
LTSVPALSRSDYGLASRALKHLRTNRVDRDELLQIAFDLTSVVRAQDVSLCLLTPESSGPRQMRLWTREIDPAALSSLTSRTNSSNPLLAAMRWGEAQSLSVHELGPRVRAWFLRSETYRQLTRNTGFVDSMVSPFRSRQGVSVGRLSFFRARGMPMFDGDRTRLLGALRDAFSLAASRIVQAQVESSGQEVALLSSAGAPLWMSNGFPFVWNSVSSCRLRIGVPALTNLINGSWFDERTAMRVLSLSQAVTEQQPPQLFHVPRRGGRTEVATELTSLPGWQFWQRDQVLRIAFHRDDRLALASARS